MKLYLALAAVFGLVQICHAASIRSHAATPPRNGVSPTVHRSPAPPTWTWARHEGGTNWESGSEVKLDGRGGVYVLGGFGSSMVFAGHQLTCGPNGSGFLAKYDVSGNLHWILSPSGGGSCSFSQLHVDQQGNAWVIGVFLGQLDLGGFKLESTRYELLITRVDSRGRVTWAIQADALAIEDSGFATAVNSRGDLFLAGSFTGEIRLGQKILTSSDLDGYLTAFNVAGQLIWLRQSGNPNPDWTQGLLVDDRDNLFVTGGILEESSRVTGREGATLVCRTVLSKYDAMGNEGWSVCSGGDGGLNWAVDLAADRFGNVIMAGQFSGEFLLGGHSLRRDTDHPGAYVASFRPDGGVAWLISLGRTEYDWIAAIAVDRRGNIYFAGDFIGETVFGGELSNPGPYPKACVAKFDSQGRGVWGWKINDRVASQSLRLGLDGFGRARLLGERGGSLPGQPEITLPHLFIAGFDRDGSEPWIHDIGSDTLHTWSTFAVDRSGDCFVVGSFEDELALGRTSFISRGSLDFFVARFGR